MTQFYQEHIEPAKPAREHVTTIDGEIQTWLPGTNFVKSKYGKAATRACIAAFLESPDMVQEYIVASILASNNLRTVADNSELSHPRVPSFWTEKH